MATPQNTRLGILLMIATCAIFAAQDGITRHLGAAVNVYMVVMIRFWFFAAFVVAVSLRTPGGLSRAARTAHPVLQLIRGLLLIAEVCLMVIAFVRLGLIETHAVFICYPLLVAALSGPILGDRSPSSCASLTAGASARTRRPAPRRRRMCPPSTGSGPPARIPR
jgi:drug/metabolite transporter (DMT)-like permease